MKKSLTTVAMALAFTFSILAIGACAKSPSDEADGNGTAAEDSVGTGETSGSGENEGSGEQTGDGGSDNGAENGGDSRSRRNQNCPRETERKMRRSV